MIATDDAVQAARTTYFLNGTHEYIYRMSSNAVSPDGNYTVMIRYSDPSRPDEFRYFNIALPSPQIVQNGLQVTVSGLDGVKSVRRAEGELSSLAEMKAAPGYRAYTASGVIHGADSYTLKFVEPGTYTVYIEYIGGYSELRTVEVTKKTPGVSISSESVTFGDLDGMTVLRYAPGTYSTAGAVKNAAGSRYLKLSAADQNGNITVSDLSGTYTFSVQYSDGSENVYHLEF